MSDDALSTARDQLEGLDDVAVDDRPALFEAVHATLAAELAALDEV